MRFYLSIAAVLASFLFVGCTEGPKLAAEKIEPTEFTLGVEVERRSWNVLGARDGQLLNTDHYACYVTGTGRTVTNLPGFIEGVFARCGEISGVYFTPKTRMPLYLLATRDQWVSLTCHIFGPDSSAAKISSGGYTYDGVTVCWRIGGQATFAVVAHEAMHQYLHYALKNRLPRWADEALATSIESFLITGQRVSFLPTNGARLADLRKGLIENAWIEIRPLLTDHSMKYIMKKSRYSGMMYYAEIYALGSMLRTHPEYKKGWQRMIVDARAGNLPQDKTPVEIFQAYVCEDLNVFSAEFKVFCRTVARLEAR